MYIQHKPQQNLYFSCPGLNDKSCLNKTVDDVNSLFGTSLSSYMEFNSTMLQSNVTKQCEIKFRTASEEFWT